MAFESTISRRDFMRTACAGAVGIALAACGSSGYAPSPKVAANREAAARDPAARAESWDQLLEAGRKEGKVVVLGPPDSQVRTELPPLFKQQTGIDMEFQGGNTSQLVAGVGSQRAAGQYLVDAVLGGSDTAYGTLLPQNWIDPLKPGLVLPEVIDHSHWKTGGPWFRDPQGEMVLQLFNTVGHSISVNADFVSPADVPSADSLLDPKWKGKICAYDPSVNGSGIAVGSALYVSKGKDWVTRLYKGQNVVLSRDYKQVADWVAHGSYPIAIGAFTNYFQPFIEAGIHIVWPKLPDVPETVSGGFGLLSVWNRPAHPHAALVFANWIASKEGLAAFAKTQRTAPVRSDIQPGWIEPDLIPKPGVKYFDSYDYEFEMNQRLAIRDFYASLLK
jgi:iron(III) transport system substrate-binding protein